MGLNKELNSDRWDVGEVPSPHCFLGGKEGKTYEKDCNYLLRRTFWNDGW